MEDVDVSDFTQEPITVITSQEYEELERIQFLKNNSVESLESFIGRLQESGRIDKKLATTIKTMSVGMESMDKHFATYPIATYTELPSSTNYSVTVESLMGAVANAASKAMDASFSVIKKINQEMDRVYRENDAKFDRIVVHIPKMVEYIKRHPVQPDSRFPGSLMILMKELSPMARWFISPSIDDPLTRRYGSPSLFIQRLPLVEASLMDSVNRYLDDGRERARDYQRVHELKGLVATQPESIAFFNQGIVIGRPKTFGDSLYGRASAIRQDFTKFDPGMIGNHREIINSAAKWMGLVDFSSIRLKDAKKYQTFHENVGKLRDTLVPIARSGTLKPGEVRLVNDYLNDVRTMSKGVLEFELWLTEYRAAVLQIAKMLYVYGKSR